MKEIDFAQRIIKNEKGSVIIEFFFMVMFLLIIFAFMADLVILRSTLGKLDNASYSLVNLLRERNQLSPGVRDINTTELRKYEELAKLLIYGDRYSKNDITVILEFKERENQTTVQGDTSKCPQYRPLASLWHLAPLSEPDTNGNQRKIPLYQVTLCVETNSLFRAILLDKKSRIKNLVRSSSLAVAR